MPRLRGFRIEDVRIVQNWAHIDEYRVVVRASEPNGRMVWLMEDATWQEIPEGTYATNVAGREMGFPLPAAALDGIADAGREHKPADEAMARHLDDAIVTRDRLLAFIERNH
jgi:hypothetical protein